MDRGEPDETVGMNQLRRKLARRPRGRAERSLAPRLGRTCNGGSGGEWQAGTIGQWSVCPGCGDPTKEPNDQKAMLDKSESDPIFRRIAVRKIGAHSHRTKLGGEDACVQIAVPA